MKSIIILLSLFLSFCNTSRLGEIKSIVSIVSRVDPHSLKVDHGVFYAVKIDLINETDSALNFWTMNCSWQVNWISKDKNIKFYINCIYNYPELIKLYPDQTISYDGIVELLDTTDLDINKNYKLGFVLIRKNEVQRDGEFYNVLNGKIDKGKDIYWSEPFKIDK